MFTHITDASDLEVLNKTLLVISDNLYGQKNNLAKILVVSLSKYTPTHTKQRDFVVCGFVLHPHLTSELP